MSLTLLLACHLWMSSQKHSEHRNGFMICTFSILSRGLLRKPELPQWQRQCFHAASDYQRFAPPTNVTLSSTGVPVFFIHSSSLLGSAQAFSEIDDDDSGSQRSRKKDEPDEKLVVQLIQQLQGATTADDVQVRLVVDIPGEKSSSSSQVVSLFEAIQMSIKEKQDLIGVANNQDIPVVCVVDLDKLRYQQRTRSKKIKQMRLKEFHFNSGIAENDLDRKIAQIVQALRKGHNCELMVHCK